MELPLCSIHLVEDCRLDFASKAGQLISKENLIGCFSVVNLLKHCLLLKCWLICGHFFFLSAGEHTLTGPWKPPANYTE